MLEISWIKRHTINKSLLPFKINKLYVYNTLMKQRGEHVTAIHYLGKSEKKVLKSYPLQALGIYKIAMGFLNKCKYCTLKQNCLRLSVYAETT